MMFRSTISVALLVMIFAGAAVADDLAPPIWRGQPGTTLQIWEFLTSANPAPPEVAVNINGAPLAIVFGDAPTTLWLDEDHNHPGVWKIDEMIELQIPNFPEPNPYKEIWLQITYNAGEASLPEFFVMPEYTSLELIQSIPISDDYLHDTYRITIEPNPACESIYVMPRYCELYVDEIVVDTICVPEPATLSVLAMGAISLLARKRRS